MKLCGYTLRYAPLKAMKGQVVGDFLAAHPPMNIEQLIEGSEKEDQVDEVHGRLVTVQPWKLWFDGSKAATRAGAGFQIKSPDGKVSRYTVRLTAKSTNNQAEYKALIAGLQRALNLEAMCIEIMGDSQVVLQQLQGGFTVKSSQLIELFYEAQELLAEFVEYELKYLPREQNEEANRLAQHASGYRPIDDN